MPKSYLFFLPVFLTLTISVYGQIDDELKNEIRIRTEQLRGAGLFVGGEKICCGQSISNVYSDRIFSPIWTDSLANQLLRQIENSELEGLFPEDYHYSLLKDLLQEKDLNVFEKANLDLLLTDSFLLYTTHLLSGKVNPVSLNPDWRVVKREGDPVELLLKAISSNNVGESIAEARPKYKTYDRLRSKLARYKEIRDAGGWGEIEVGPTIKPGESGQRVLQVRKRLEASGDLVGYTNDEPEIFDEELKRAVLKYQRRYGLEEDGAVGKSTLASMNVPVELRIEDIILNLERCRWLPRELGDHYIIVNLPAYEMELVKDGEIKLEMGVAVGKPYRQTPVFSSKMTYFVVNPYWTVPPTILYQDMIPAQIKNPNYLSSLQIKVLDESGNEVDPASVTWQTGVKFPYTLRQEPGKMNALGRVKFIFPNEFNIYMHDTNHPEVFAKYNRALSSGCVRLSDPMKLAYYVGATQNKPLSVSDIDEISKSKSNQTIIMNSPIMVHLQYWTAFVDENGFLNFRPDIYDRNSKLKKALFSSL